MGDELLGGKPPGDDDGAVDAAGEWQQLLQAIARAADVCFKPFRHAVRLQDGSPSQIGDCSDCVVLIEARNSAGQRCRQRDLELEIYRSGEALNLMLSRIDGDAPLLWHGSHPVWMQPDSGERCPRPADGAELEALCRRLRALLGRGDQT